MKVGQAEKVRESKSAIKRETMKVLDKNKEKQGPPAKMAKPIEKQIQHDKLRSPLIF